MDARIWIYIRRKFHPLPQVEFKVNSTEQERFLLGYHELAICLRSSHRHTRDTWDSCGISNGVNCTEVRLLLSHFFFLSCMSIFIVSRTDSDDLLPQYSFRYAD